MVAVKKLQPNKQSTLEDFCKEIKTLSMMCCDYIVKYRGVCYSMGNVNVYHVYVWLIRSLQTATGLVVSCLCGVI